MKYVLDTNTVASLMKGAEVSVQKLAALSRGDVAIPQPVMAEIEYGIERLPRSKRKTQLQQRLAWIRSEITRASWSDKVSRVYGQVKAHLEARGERIEDFDAAIAAHALAEGAVLVTAKVKHLGRVRGLITEDWSAPPPANPGSKPSDV